VNFIDKALAHEDAKAKAALTSEGSWRSTLVAKKKFEKPFVELEPKEQDEILAALESGKAEGGRRAASPPRKFFATVTRAHTVIGFLADPKYGGNRGYAGWKVVGYPGGGHHMGGYSPVQNDRQGEDQDRLGRRGVSGA
jgi:hypothetical protein